MWNKWELLLSQLTCISKSVLKNNIYLKRTASVSAISQTSCHLHTQAIVATRHGVRVLKHGCFRQGRQLAFPGLGPRGPSSAAAKGRVSPREPLSSRVHKVRPPNSLEGVTAHFLRRHHSSNTGGHLLLRITRCISPGLVCPTGNQKTNRKITVSRSVRSVGSSSHHPNCRGLGCFMAEAGFCPKDIPGGRKTYLSCPKMFTEPLLDTDEHHRRTVAKLRNLKFHPP